MHGHPDTSATFFFITDQRSTDRTAPQTAALSAFSSSGQAAKVAYRVGVPPGAQADKAGTR